MRTVCATATNTLVKISQMKKIKIVYLPGYGGNFLQALFSLDPSTQPSGIIEIDTLDTPDHRADCYINLLRDRKALHFDLGKNQHASPQYGCVVQAVHPKEFDFNEQCDKVLQVDLDWSNFSNYWLIQSKINMDHQMARLRAEEIKKSIQIKKWFNTHPVSINPFLDLRLWTQEYVTVNRLLGLPDHLDAANKLHKFWYDLRVSKIVKSFETVGAKEFSKYCFERLKQEVYGAPTFWQTFYERVRDPQWPDCSDEKDFVNLPQWIQHELIVVFGYQPQIQA